MRAVCIRVLCIGVTVCTTYLGRRSLMRKALHILVAIDTTEHAAMDRVLQFALVHKQAGLFSVHVLRQ